MTIPFKNQAAKKFMGFLHFLLRTINYAWEVWHGRGVGSKAKLVANFDSNKKKAPTMEEIDTRKHEVRKYYANK
jgi:hypothetical protein